MPPTNEDDEFVIRNLKEISEEIELGIAAVDHTAETIRMTIDSGSAVTIIPSTKARDYPSHRTEMQRTGKCYAAANGSRIENEGEKLLMRQAQGQHSKNEFR